MDPSFSQIGCAFYEFGPKSNGPNRIDIILATSDDGGASFNTREKVTNRAWDPTVDAPLSYGDPGTTFIGEYFGLAASSLGFYPFWTDTRTGIQEMFIGQLLRLGPRTGKQFSGTVEGNQSQSWFTFNWPADWDMTWTVVPTTVRNGAPEIEWDVAVERASPTTITCWITVRNLTSSPVDIESRYAIYNVN